MDRMVGTEPGHVSNPAQDADAFAAFVEQQSVKMYRLAFRLMGNDQDAKDVVQESWVRAYQRRNQFEGRADVGTWLHRIVVNCALDMLRAGRRRSHHVSSEPFDAHALTIPAPAPDPEQLALSAETGQRIAAAIETLNPVERVAFTLRHFDGCSIDQIAQTIGLRHNNVKQHIFRAIRKLRVVLEVTPRHS